MRQRDPKPQAGAELAQHLARVGVVVNDQQIEMVGH